MTARADAGGSELLQWPAHVISTSAARRDLAAVSDDTHAHLQVRYRSCTATREIPRRGLLGMTACWCGRLCATSLDRAVISTSEARRDLAAVSDDTQARLQVR